MSLLTEHAAELRRDHIETRVEVTITRRPATDSAEPAPSCRACRRAPATVDVAAELRAVDPSNQPAEGSLGHVGAPLCDACLAWLAPALPQGLAAAESTADGAVDASAVSGLLKWLGASTTQVAGALVRLVGDTPTEEGDPHDH